MKIWEEEINAKGGLLGRPVKLVYYDDQTNASTVPGIYTKLLDVDKVDLVLGPYATNMAAPAMPVVMQKGKLFIILFGLAVNHEFNYNEILRDDPDRARHRSRPSPRASSRSPRRRTRSRRRRRWSPPTREFSRNACEGARENAKKHGFKIVYDKTYPPTTTDFTPIVRAIQATNPDLVAICSYPLELGRHGQGGERARLQAEDDRRRHGRPAGDRVQDAARAAAQRLRQLRDLGAVQDDDVRRHRGVPQEVPGARRRRRRRSARLLSGAWGYAYIQVLGEAIEGAKSLDDDKLADYIRKTTFKTIMGDVKFGKQRRVGEGPHAAGPVPRHQEATASSSSAAWTTRPCSTPAEYKTGNVIYPYEKAK